MRESMIVLYGCAPPVDEGGTGNPWTPNPLVPETPLPLFPYIQTTPLIAPCPECKRHIVVGADCPFCPHECEACKEAQITIAELEDRLAKAEQAYEKLSEAFP